MISVLAYPAFANKAANPYNAILYSFLERRGIHVLEFTPANVVSARWDVFHFHWPEAPFGNPRRLRGRAEDWLFRTALYRTRRMEAKLIWTVHNVWPHKRHVHRRYEQRMRRLWPMLDAIVVMNSATVSELGRAAFASDFDRVQLRAQYIPHPVYQPEAPGSAARDRSNPSHPMESPGNGAQVLVAGAIAPYKGIERLEALAAAGPQLRFRVIGRVLDPSYSRQLEQLFERRENIEFRPGALSEDRLRSEIASAGCVLLPYKRIHNSGSGVLAASLGRPVLLTRSPAFDELQRYLPPGYVRCLSESDEEAVETMREMAALPRVATEVLDLVQAEFQPDVVAEAHSKLYSDLLRGQ